VHRPMWRPSLILVFQFQKKRQWHITNTRVAPALKEDINVAFLILQHKINQNLKYFHKIARICVAPTPQGARVKLHDALG
jgi:hypothetical protein